MLLVLWASTVERPVTMLMIMTLVGVALPFVGYLLAERYGLLRLLGLGSPAGTTAVLNKPLWTNREP
jgi:hypothetical protein